MKTSRSWSSLHVLLLLFPLCVGCSDGNTPSEQVIEFGTSQAPVIGGLIAPTTDIDQGFGIKIDAIRKDMPAGSTERCTGVVMRDQFVLTAKHCFAKPDGTLDLIKVSFSNKGYEPVTAYSFYLHPTLDLALVKPKDKLSLIIPKVPDKDTFQGDLTKDSFIDRLYGFGCTENGKNVNTLKIARMQIATATDGPEATTGGYTSWVRQIINSVGSNGRLWKGDSGGGGFIIVDKKPRLATIHFASQSILPSGGACQPTVGDGETASETTLFRSVSVPNFSPDPLPWIFNTMGGKTPENLPQQASVLGPIKAPNTDWIDLTGDGLPEFVSWGADAAGILASGLYATVNKDGNLVGSSVQLISEDFSSALSKVLIGDITGDVDGLPEVLYASASDLVIYPGASKQLDPVATFGALFSLPLPSSLTGGFGIQTALVPTGNGKSNAVLILVDDPTTLNSGLVALLNPAQIVGAIESGNPFLPLIKSIPSLQPGVPFGFQLVNLDADAPTELVVVANESNRFIDAYDLDPNTGVVDYKDSINVTDFCPAPNPILWADVTGDSIADLICHYPDALDVYRGLGNFNLDLTKIHTSWFPFSLPLNPVFQKDYPNFWQQYFAFADVNGDKIPDYVNYTFTTELWVRPGVGDGTFAPLEVVDLAASPLSQAYGFNIVATDKDKQPKFAIADANIAASQGQRVHLLSYPKQPVDSDGDTIPDYLDLCPDKKNSLQDLDTDGIDDVCDPTYIDSDGDKVNDEQDNCLNVQNSDQKNCNYEAEKANGALVLGDACDPTPCAIPTAATLSEGSTLFHASFKAGEKIITYGVLKPTYSIAGFDVRPSPQYNPNAKINNQINPTTIVPKTNYRYCLDLKNQGFKCGDDLIFQDALMSQNAPKRAAEKIPSPEQPWRRISIQGLTGFPEGGGLYDGTDQGSSGQGLSYNSGQFNRLWHWKQDFQAWRSALNINVFDELADPDGVSGLLGAHAESSYGTEGDSFGVHGQAQDPTVAAGGIAIGVSVSPKPKLTGPTLLDILLKSLGDLVSDPEQTGVLMMPSEDAPYSLRPSCLERELCRGIRPGETIPIFRIPENPDLSGVLEVDGRVRQVGSDLSPGVRQALSNGTRMIAASEPSRLIARASEHPVAVGLSSDGLTLIDTYVFSNGALSTNREACGLRCTPPRLAAAAVAKGEPRTGSVVAYSGSLATIFVAGGTSPEGELRHDIIWQNINTLDGWHTIPVPQSHKLGRIVDITWSYADEALWVLDEIGTGGMKKMRLSRINPSDGATSELGRWSRLHSFDRHWLVPDHDRQMLLIASNTHGGHHAVVRLSVDSPSVVSNLRFKDGAILSRPNVSPVGYTFFVSQGKKKMPGIKRLDTLENKPGKWSDLGGCF